MRPRLLDLFSGVGGFSLAAHTLGIPTVAFCECEPYPVRVLNRHWPDVPVFPDVKELTTDALADTTGAGCVRSQLGRDLSLAANRAKEASEQRLLGTPGADAPRGGNRAALIITAGFPCQDISYAGKGAGLEGERSGLFFEVVRLVRELGPDFVLLENVAALVTRGLPDVLGALSDVGMDAVWGVVRASDVGAPHRRERIWIVAYPQGTADGVRIANHVRSRLTPWGSGETWPTATASDAWAGEHNRSQVIPCNGRVLTGKAGLGLGQAARGEFWPTPDCQNVRDGRSTRVESTIAEGGKHGVSLHHATEYGTEKQSGSLNPDWVETLMGYPIGYTRPECEPMLWLPGEWPAGLGAPQHPWEPPRLTTVKENRAARLKALGNSIVPHIAQLWLEAIVVAAQRREAA